MNEKIVIIGKSGLLAKSMIDYLKNLQQNIFIFSPNHAPHKIDITNKDLLINSLNDIEPDLIINCSGNVNLEFCEKNPEKAWNLNTIAVSNIISWIKDRGCKYIGISTDQLYNQNNSAENDEIFIKNQYAASKYCAENLALSYNNSLIIRTNIIGFRGQETPTFFEWILDSIKKKKRLDLFHDYYTSSIDVNSFSKILFDLHQTGYKGIVNVGSREFISKADFIKRVYKKLGFSDINSCKSTVDNLPIQRSKNCGMNVSKAEELLNYKLPTIDEVIQSLLEERNEKTV